MKKLIFYRKESSVPQGAEVLSFIDGRPAFEAQLIRFEVGAVDTLYVPAALCTGWRTKLFANDFQVQFIDEGWPKNELMQAQNRHSIHSYMPKDFTVLLLRPDYMADQYGTDTYLAFITAKDVETAVTQAQEEVRDVDYPENEEKRLIDPTDYLCLFVAEGHHNDLTPSAERKVLDI